MVKKTIKAFQFNVFLNKKNKQKIKMNRNERDLKFLENLQLLIIKDKSSDNENYNILLDYFKDKKVKLKFQPFKTFLENLSIKYNEINNITELVKIKDLYELDNSEYTFEYYQVMAILFKTIELLGNDLSPNVRNILESNLSGSFDANRVRFSSMYLLLFYIYKIEHKNDKKEFEKKYNVEEFFDENQTTLNDRNLDCKYEKIFHNLKQFLNNKDENFRSQAHKLCHDLGISLSLTKMLDFSVNSINKNIENLFMLIGPTGCGKSTLINYLDGVEYERIFSRLNPKLGHSNKLKVGNGSMSETLYCETLNISKDNSIKINVCDTPGFFDTNSDEKAIVASLGVPLTVHYAKRIRAIIICVEYDSLKFSTGCKGLLFQTVISSLMSIFKNFEQNLNQVQFLFAITKCPSGNSMESNLDELKYELNSFNDSRDNYENDIKKLQEKIVNKEDEKKLYDEYLLVLKDIKECKKLQKEWILITKLKNLFSNEKTSDANNNSEFIHKELQQNVVSLDKTWDQRLADSYKRHWSTNSQTLGEKLQELNSELDNKQYQIKIVDMLLKNFNGDVLENVFFFRCDNNDDKNKFLDKLLEITNTNKEINKEIFNFNINQKIFQKIESWLSEKVNKLTAKLKKIEKFFDEINKIVKEIQILNIEIKIKEKDLNSYLVIDLENSNKLTEEDFKVIRIENAKVERSKILMESLENSIKSKVDLIDNIKQGITSHKIISWKKSYFESRFFNLFRRKDWDYNYSYPYNDEHNPTGKSKNISKVPIEKVLLHCLDKENKDFKTITIDSSNTQTEYQVEHVGKFVIMKNNFENGIFDINFRSDRKFDGSIKLRFLTKTINLKEYLIEIARIEESIKTDKESLLTQQTINNQSKKSYEFEKNIIKLKSQGLLKSKERANVIIERLRSLNYDEDQFLTKLIKILILKVDKDILKNIFNFDLLISRNLIFDRNESQLEKLGKTNRSRDHYFENNFDVVKYLNDEEILILKEITDKSGLSYVSMNSILNGFKNSLFDDIELPLFKKWII